MAFAKRSIGDHNAKAQNEADEAYDRSLEKIERFLDATSNDDGHTALILAQRLEALVDGGVLASLLTNGSVNPPIAPIATPLTTGAILPPASTPSALGVGSPAPAPVAPVAPVAPSPAEVIGLEFLARFAGHDIAPALDFLTVVHGTGLRYESCEKVLNAVVRAPIPGQMIDYVDQLSLNVADPNHPEALRIPDPTNGKVILKTVDDAERREAGHKNDILKIASAIAGTPVTFPAGGTRPIIDAAIDAAEETRRERIELVDAITNAFRVSLTGGQTMTDFVTAAKNAATAPTAPTAPTPIVPTSGIDLMAEIDRDTNLKRNGATDRDFADTIVLRIKEAHATHELCGEMIADNNIGGNYLTMSLPVVTHRLLSVLAVPRRGLFPQNYTVPAMPVI